MLELSLRHAFTDFTLEADLQAEGGITALFGRSGSGKTTIVNILAGLLKPDQGRIVLNGDVLLDTDKNIHMPPERRRMGYVFQEGRLFPHLSVRNNLTYGQSHNPAAQDQGLALEHVTELLGIADLLDRRPQGLSGGEKQRVAIGRALLSNPRLLLMDEPLASLDGPRRSEILPYMERLRDELGLPMVYVSHSLDEVIRLADLMVIVDQGRTVATGKVEDLTGRLDLRPLTGRHEAGSVLVAEVSSHDEDFGLSLLKLGKHTLTVPRLNLPSGTMVRVRIHARDVALALQAPAKTSILNQFSGTVRELSDDGEVSVDVLVDIGLPTSPLWARITRKSRQALALKSGSPVHALVKAVSIDRHSLGRRDGKL